MVTSLLPYRYPVDLTGTSPDNLIVDEIHTPTRRKVRCIAPMNAPFFRDNLKVYDGNNTTPLTEGQYKCMNLIPLPTAMAGGSKEVYAIIAITDVSVGDTIRLEYHTVGGDFVQSFEAAVTLLEALTQDTRPTSWENVLNKPDSYPASLHLHAVGDSIGWEYAAVAIQQIREAILNGDARGHDTVLSYIDIQTQALAALIAAQSGAGQPLGNHVAATNNPHNVTKAQVGLGLVQNFPVATNSEATAGVALDRYMTPSLVSLAIENISSVSLGSHPSNTNNPHQTTAAQVGLGNVANYAPATVSEGVAGTRSDLYMTPAASKAAVDAAIANTGTVGAAHIADMANPHQTNKSQVGLGLVENYAMASTAETVAGTINNKYVHPAGVKGAVDALRTTQTQALNTHIANTNNPHNVTKTQLGLDVVQNFQTATEAEAIAGTAADRYMTPVSMKAALVSLGIDVSGKVNSNLLGAASGVAPLNSDGLIAQSYLLNAPGSNVRDIHYFKTGRPTIASVLTRSVLTRAMAWLIDFTGSYAYCAVAPDVAVTLTLRKGTTSIGTITFAPNSLVGVFAGFAGSMAVGEVFEIYYDGTGDTLLQDLVIGVVTRAST